MKPGELAASLDLAGRVAIVTGASRGIGRAIATGFAAQGASVVVASRRHDGCADTVSEIESTGGTAHAVASHLGRLDDIEALVTATVERFGGIDVVVNNAANPLRQRIGEITPEAWQKALDTNLRGPVFLVQAALPHLERGGGSVINVVSNAAYLYARGHLLYAAAKAGLDAATRSMAADLADRGIRVNALVPGTVDTTMVRSLPPEARDASARASLLGRAADADELVAMAVLLASDAGGFMTGHSYFVDGGQSYR